jgi:peptide/nickel transport system permease protein
MSETEGLAGPARVPVPGSARPRTGAVTSRGPVRSPGVARLIRRLRTPDGLLGVALVVVVLLCLVGAQWIATHDPFAVNVSVIFQEPSSTHFMGTDQFGRDVFSRVVYGSRYSLAMGLLVVLFSTLLGLVLGSAAGFFGGWVDEIVMRLTDLVMGFPALLFAMLIAAVLGSNLQNAVIAASAIWWPSYVRLLRGEVLAGKNEMYVEAARAIGSTNTRVIVRHVLPNSWAPLIVRGTMDVGRAVIFTGSLSFIGLGAQPPLPEWGTMLAESRAFILGAWWCITFPGIAILATVVGFSLIGDVADEVLRPFSREG